MNRIKTLLGVLCIACCGAAMSQTDDDKFRAEFEAFKQQAQNEFNTFKHDAEKEYEEFRRKANEEYANFMATPWTFFESNEAVEAPKSPEPPVPEIKKPEEPKQEEVELPFEVVIPEPERCAMPEPPVPIKAPVVPAKNILKFSYYNTECSLGMDDDIKFSLDDVSEKAVSDAWKKLSNKQVDDFVANCLQLRKDMQLCDWGYITMLDTIAINIFGKKTNEGVVLQMYVLTQSGYNVRIARTDNKLVLLLPTKEVLYNYTYLMIDNERYYVIDQTDADGFMVFNHAFPKEKMSSLQIRTIPNLVNVHTNAKNFESEAYPDVKVAVAVNKNLVDFYNSYPLGDWNNYVSASLSKDVKDVLYPMLKKQIEGKTQEEAANILINFVQTAFEYKVDDEQFGYERPLFADEVFYYPYSDCEDRSILFAVLVNELMGLEVVLLHYPGHLATAVRFSNDIVGDYINLDGDKYIVCDPTYIGASIGEAMERYKNEQAKVVKIK